jgi:hypothetical protein
MMNSKVYLLLTLLFAANLSYAQTILTGIVRDARNQPLPGILLEVETKSQPPATAFVISATDGSFKLTLPSTTGSDSLRLSARALGYATQLVRLTNRSQAVPLTMREETTRLKEVNVRGAPITRSHDTLSYKVDAFSSAKDRVISDVLKKMPGIEVGSDGQISYEGKPISKFYINGQDLLENRYNLASDNLPAGAVQSVQVLENHQPVRALDSLIRPDNAALNIKLKNKVTATGQARLGAGLVPHPTTGLWQANLSPMLFVPKQQLIDTYQTNNTGQDVLAELKPLSFDDLSQQLESSNRKPDLTHIQQLGQPPIASNRYLFNKAHLLSANHLLTLSKEQQIRLNISYLHDAQMQMGSTQTLYVLPNQPPVALTEYKQNKLYINNLLADLAFIKNVKKYYLKNTLSFNGAWDSQVGKVQQVERQVLIAQQAHNPFLSFTNRLGVVRPASQGRLVQVNSLLFYTTSPQQLAVAPGPFAGTLNGGIAYDTARQQARLGSFFTSNSVSLISGHRHWGFTNAIGFSQEIQHLTSSLDLRPNPATTDPLRHNNLAWVRGKYYAQPAASYKTDTWDASLEMPISYWNFSITDAPLAAAQQLRTVTVEPRLNLHYNISTLWRLSGSSDLTNRFGEITQLNYAYLLHDYRTLQRSAAPLARSLAWSTNAGLYYKNPLTSWFFHTNYRFSLTENNLLYSNTVQSDGALTTVAVAQYSQVLTHVLSGSASKFISPLKTNLSAQLSGNFSQQPQLLNGTLTQSRTRTATATFKASVSAFDWGSLEYNASLTALRNTVAEAAVQSLTVLQDHHVSLAFYLASKHQLLVATDYYDSRGPAPRVQNVFTDITYRYTLPTVRKLDIELKASNLFDSQQYQYSFVNQFVLVQNSYALRPRQVLASVRLSL